MFSLLRLRNFPSFFYISAILLAALTFSACSSKSSGASDADGLGGGAFSDQDLALGSDVGRFGTGNIPLPQEGGVFEDVRFAFDSSAVPSEYHSKLQDYARVISGDPTLRVEVEGHCDSRGTNEYNLALGEERAKAVAALLTSFGASPDQLSTISYGEEIPLDPANTEEAWAKNRRAHFALSRSSAPASRRY